MLDEISALDALFGVSELIVTTVWCGSDIYLRALMTWSFLYCGVPGLYLRFVNVGHAERSPKQWRVEVVGALTVNAVLTCIDRRCVRWDLVVWGVVFLAVRR